MTPAPDLGVTPGAQSGAQSGAKSGQIFGQVGQFFLSGWAIFFGQVGDAFLHVTTRFVLKLYSGAPPEAPKKCHLA